MYISNVAYFNYEHIFKTLIAIIFSMLLPRAIIMIVLPIPIKNNVLMTHVSDQSGFVSIMSLNAFILFLFLVDSMPFFM
jgi:Ca2+/H+ antiporter